MKHALTMEAIGDNFRWANRRGIKTNIKPPEAWVAEIKRSPSGEIQRGFLRAHKDYARSNGVGSRGVTLLFLLEERRIYEVQRPLSWVRSEHFYITHDGTDWLRLTTREALAYV